MGAKNTVYLISCVSVKRASPAAARDLYISPWFKKARHYVERKGCPWFILSAEHGLVRPNEMIAPYTKTLNAMPINERRKSLGFTIDGVARVQVRSKARARIRALEQQSRGRELRSRISPAPAKIC